jgi:hypothetical protein
VDALGTGPEDAAPLLFHKGRRPATSPPLAVVYWTAPERSRGSDGVDRAETPLPALGIVLGRAAIRTPASARGQAREGLQDGRPGGFAGTGPIGGRFRTPPWFSRLVPVLTSRPTVHIRGQDASLVWWRPIADPSQFPRQVRCSTPALGGIAAPSRHTIDNGSSGICLCGRAVVEVDGPTVVGIRARTPVTICGEDFVARQPTAGNCLLTGGTDGDQSRRLPRFERRGRSDYGSDVGGSGGPGGSGHTLRTNRPGHTLRTNRPRSSGHTLRTIRPRSSSHTLRTNRPRSSGHTLRTNRPGHTLRTIRPRSSGHTLRTNRPRLTLRTIPPGSSGGSGHTLRTIRSGSSGSSGHTLRARGARWARGTRGTRITAQRHGTPDSDVAGSHPARAVRKPVPRRVAADAPAGRLAPDTDPGVPGVTAQLGRIGRRQGADFQAVPRLDNPGNRRRGPVRLCLGGTNPGSYGARCPLICRCGPHQLTRQTETHRPQDKR